MANLKFSQFTEQTDASNVQFLVGYNGSTNVRIAPGNISDLGGNGTVNTIAMFTPNGNTIGNSTITLDNPGAVNESVTSSSKVFQIGTGATGDFAQLNLLSPGSSGIIDASGSGNLILRTNSSSTAQLVLDDTGSLQAKSYGSGTFTGTATYALSVDSTGNIIETTAGGGGSVGGNGTVNTIAMFTPNGTTIGDSPLIKSGFDDLQSTGSLQLGQFKYLTFGNIGNSDNFIIQNSISGSTIRQSGSGLLGIQCESEVSISASAAGGGTEALAKFKEDGPIELYYDNVKTFETTSTGITVTGTQSSFTGQVTIPTTPVAATDAASKAYVDSQSGGGGGVSGDGNQYNIPVWNGTTELSGITSNTVANKLLSGITTTYITAVTGSDVPTEHVIKNYDNQGNSTGTLTYNQSGVLRFSGGDGGRIDVGLNAANIANSDLNVGTGVATFKGGVIISNSPGGVQVDNSSLVIGSGTNDNISGSDHCLIVGSGNQITSDSDQSVAFGQGNAITSSTDAFAVGNSNTLTSSLRTQAFGFNNTITASSSFVAGGGNSINANANIFALGDGHTVTTTGSTEDAYLIGTGNTITGGTGSFAIGSNLDGDTGNHMVIGYRNNKTSYPTTNYSLGLGNTKFALAVGSTTTTNSNALLITEGGVNRGGSGVAQVPRVLLPTVTGFSASNDAAADALGVPQGALYQNQGVIQINRGSGSTTDPLAGGSGNTNYSVQVLTANATGQKNYLYVLTGGSTITLTMPSSPSPGDSIKVVNLTTVTTCVIAQGGSPIMAVGQDMILDNNKANFELAYTDVTRGWVVIGATGEI